MLKHVSFIRYWLGKACELIKGLKKCLRHEKSIISMYGKKNPEFEINACLIQCPLHSIAILLTVKCHNIGK